MIGFVVITKRDWLGCPASDAGAALVMPYVNIEAMNLHLAEIAKEFPPRTHAVIIIDGAGWYKSDDLVVPDNPSLLRLPPYSPELNAQENIWQYLPRTISSDASSAPTTPSSMPAVPLGTL